MIQLLSPLTGTAIPLEQVPDNAFSRKLLGDGVAILPEDGKLLSPVEGTVSALVGMIPEGEWRAAGDTSLKGIFFKDDDFGHMAWGIEAHWGENSRTEIRICELEDLLECPIFMKNEPNP